MALMALEGTGWPHSPASFQQRVHAGVDRTLGGHLCGDAEAGVLGRAVEALAEAQALA